MSAKPPPLPLHPTVDLRRITVAQMIEGLTRGDAWAWKLSRQLVATAALVARRHARRHTPTAMPAVVLPPPAPERLK